MRLFFNLKKTSQNLIKTITSIFFFLFRLIKNYPLFLFFSLYQKKKVLLTSAHNLKLKIEVGQSLTL